MAGPPPAQRPSEQIEAQTEMNVGCQDCVKSPLPSPRQQSLESAVSAVQVAAGQNAPLRLTTQPKSGVTVGRYTEQLVNTGCDGGIVFSKTPGRCESFAISAEYADHLNRYLRGCVFRALVAAPAGSGMIPKSESAIEKIEFAHTYDVLTPPRSIVNSDSSSGTSESLHSFGRAIDFTQFRIRVRNSDGGSSEIVQSVGNSLSRNFERHFRTCWAESQQKKCNVRSIGGTYKGVLGYDFYRGRQSHLHLSLPYCERRRGVATG